MVFRLRIYDNFHHMDESEAYTTGEFLTAEEALAKARSYVDDFLQSNFKPGMTADDLYKQYTSFGEDPFVISTTSEDVKFSAWTYAKMRCQEICK